MTKCRLKLVLLASVIVVGLMGMGVSAWAAAPKDALAFTPQTSNNDVTPTYDGVKNQWFYAYCLPSGSSLSDTFTVNFTVTNNSALVPDKVPSATFTITGNVAGDPAIGNGISFSPASVSITDTGDGGSESQTVTISTGSLADGTYNVNIVYGADPANEIQLSTNTIHITVAVGGACNPGSCLLTDSNFLPLTDCSGANVNANTGGTFAIVQNNKGKVVSTNPGQFYYNLFWTNTSGIQQTVTIFLNATNLVPQGANSIHAFTFNSTGFTQNLTNFDMVNTLGQPCGQNGPCTITVNSGDTLWVTWHLAYQWIGSVASTLNLPSFGILCPAGSTSATCSGYGAISATGSVYAGNLSSPSGTPLNTCTASACGYLKN